MFTLPSDLQYSLQRQFAFQVSKVANASARTVSWRANIRSYAYARVHSSSAKNEERARTT